MKVYEYRVVTNNGAGVYSKHKRFSEARLAAAAIAQEWHERGHPDMVFEIERMETTPHGTYRYWMRHRTRWVRWSHSRNASERQPDWVWRCGTPTPEASPKSSPVSLSVQEGQGEAPGASEARRSGGEPA